MKTLRIPVTGSTKNSIDISRKSIKKIWGLFIVPGYVDPALGEQIYAGIFDKSSKEMESIITDAVDANLNDFCPLICVFSFNGTSELIAGVDIETLTHQLYNNYLPKPLYTEDYDKLCLLITGYSLEYKNWVILYYE